VIMAKHDGFAGFAQKVVGSTAATGDLSGRVWTADKMPDAQFMTALRIIRAQASTELGSIQQHRMVYEQLDGGSLTGLDKEIVEGMHRTDPTGHRLDAMDAVPGGIVPPRGGRDPHESDRGGGDLGQRELRDRGPPAHPEHVVSSRPGDVRLGTRRGPRQGRLQDAEERGGAANLHR